MPVANGLSYSKFIFFVPIHCLINKVMHIMTEIKNYSLINENGLEQRHLRALGKYPVKYNVVC